MNNEPERALPGTHIGPGSSGQAGFPLAPLTKVARGNPLPEFHLQDPIEAELLAAEELRPPLSRGQLARLQVLRNNALRAREFGRMTIEIYTIQVLLLGFLALATWVTGYYIMSRGETAPAKPFTGTVSRGAPGD